MTALTWRRALAWRMERHGLVSGGYGSAVDAARGLCGLHAQVMSSADLTAFVRGASPDRSALTKTWAVRGTLHLLPTDELPTWHAAFSTYEHFLKPAWAKNFGFASPDAVEDLIAALDATLGAAGGPLTREELAEAIPEHAEKLRESWGACLKPAAFRGVLAFGEPRGQNVTFVKPPPGERPPSGEAVDALTRKYLAAFAPARREDLSRWWGTNALSAAKAQRRIEALGEEVAEVDVEGSRCYVLAADLDSLRDAAPAKVARLVPLFDQYVVNSNRGVEQLLPQTLKDRVFRQAGWISPCILVDGAIAGVWKHERKGSRVEIALDPFTPLPGWARKQLDADVERLTSHLAG